jgi:hypothetical protein
LPGHSVLQLCFDCTSHRMIHHKSVTYRPD